MAKKEVAEILEKVGIKDSENLLEIPPQPELGDLAFPCFELAKKQKRNPNQIAEEIKRKLKIPKGGLVERVEVKGAYVNFFLNYKKIGKRILKEIISKKEKFGKKTGNKTVIVEYSSPNPVHPIHVGSARSTFIGESLARILEFTGFKVKRLFLVNNLGKQVAVLIWGFLNFPREKRPIKKPDHWLLDIYVDSNEKNSENSRNEIEVEHILSKYEKGDKKVSAVGKRIVDLALKGFKETYENFGIKFDDFIWESKFIKEGKEIVEQLLKKKLAFRTEGAVVVDLEKQSIPNTIVLRADGSGLYLTRDLATTLYKFKKYKPLLNVYVVAEDQNLHFKQHFKILELLGYENLVKKSVHLNFGYVMLPEGKLSSRLGRVILLDDVLKEAQTKAAAEVVKRKTELDKKTIEKIAKEIAVSATVYSILKIEPNKQVMFDFDEVLSFEGDTGPYLQYTHTRCNGILKKAGKWKFSFESKDASEIELNVIKKLNRFTEILGQSSRELRPHLICNYVYDLANGFNSFYQSVPVLKADKKTKEFRLTLVYSVKTVLSICLKLMGLKPLERM